MTSQTAPHALPHNDLITLHNRFKKFNEKSYSAYERRRDAELRGILREAGDEARLILQYTEDEIDEFREHLFTDGRYAGELGEAVELLSVLRGLAYRRYLLDVLDADPGLVPKLGLTVGCKDLDVLEAALQEEEEARRREQDSASPLAVERGKVGKIKHYVKAPDVFIPLTSFELKPIEVITTEDGEHVRAMLRAPAGKQAEVVFPPDAWTGPAKFIKCLPSAEFCFTGSSTADIQMLRLHTASFYEPYKVRRTIGVKVAGYHDGAFVTEDGLLIGSGAKKRFTLIGDGINTGCRLLKVKNAEIHACLDPLFSFNDSEVAFPLLGWCIAALYKPLLMQTGEGFPLLNIVGEAGSGKTSTIRAVAMRLFAMEREPRAISEQTRFSLLKLVSSSNCLPIFLDENKSSKQNDQQRAQVSELIRCAYNALEGHRGRQDQKLENYRFEAPICILGETGFNEPAALDRLVIIQMSKRDSRPHLKEFLALQQLALELIGRQALGQCLAMEFDQVKALLAIEAACVGEGLTDRPKHNAAVCRFGLRRLGELLGREFPEESYRAIDRAVSTGISEDEEGEHDRKSAVDQMIELMGRLSEKDVKQFDRIRADYEFSITENDHLLIYLQGVYEILTRFSREYGYEGDFLPLRDFRRQVKREPYFVRGDRMYIGGRQRRGVCLDVAAMKAKGLEIPIEWDLAEK